MSASRAPSVSGCTGRCRPEAVSDVEQLNSPKQTLDGALVKIRFLREKQGGPGTSGPCSAVAAVFLCASTAYAGGWVSKTQPEAPGAELCSELLKRLNSLPERCAPDAIESYPGFRDPPWETLKAEEHVDLIARLLLSVGKGPAAAWQASDEQLAYKRQGAQDFAARGGLLRVWRSHVFSNLGDTHERPAPPGPQLLAQLIWGSGKSGGSKDCPGHSTDGWVRQTFLLKPDMSGPDPDLGVGKAYALLTHQPMLFGSQVVFIGASDVFQDVPGLGLTGGFCAFQHAPSKR